MLVECYSIIFKYYTNGCEGKKMHQAVQESRWVVQTDTMGACMTRSRALPLKWLLGGGGDYVRVGVL